MEEVRVMEINSSGNENSNQTAVLLLGHGSQAKHVQGVLESIAESVGKYCGIRVVSASLQFSEMNITKAISALYADGIRDLIIAPLFLFRGNHILQDIPEWLESDKEKFPGLTFTITNPIGEDLRVAEAVSSRIIHAYLSDRSKYQPVDTQKFLLKKPMDIEEESFQIIEGLVSANNTGYKQLSKDLKKVLFRMIHAAGDPALINDIVIDDATVAAGAAAIKDEMPVYCDVNMVESALSKNLLSQFNIKTHVFVNDEDVVKESREQGITRAILGVRKARKMFGDDLIYLIGNSPTALFEVLRLAEIDGHRPRLIVGTPVGFVGAREAKSELIHRSDLDRISLFGYKGGSPMCAAAFNGLLRVASS